jgi:hypothetical protein
LPTKFITGMDDAGDELRLEARLVELLVLLVELAMASCWRPKTLTTLWPVNISSTWPLRSPVCSHCAANCFCERLAMSIVSTTESGTVSSEISASSQLIVSIMMSTPMMVSTT